LGAGCALLRLAGGELKYIPSSSWSAAALRPHGARIHAAPHQSDATTAPPGQRGVPAGGEQKGRGCCPLAFHLSGGRAGACVDVGGWAGKQAQVCVHDCPYRRFAMIAARSAMLPAVFPTGSSGWKIGCSERTEEKGARPDAENGLGGCASTKPVTGRSSRLLHPTPTLLPTNCPKRLRAPPGDGGRTQQCETLRNSGSRGHK
jgi:hypothetical protein